MPTHAEKIRKALEALVEDRPKKIIAWIGQHFNDEKINEQSYRGDLMGLSLNHPSSHHYSGSKKILWFNQEKKSYRLASQSEIENYTKKQNITAGHDLENIDGTLTSKIDPSGKIFIPIEIRKKTGMDIGDRVAFILNQQGVLELRKAKLRLEIL